MKNLPTPNEIVQRHLNAVQSNDFNVAVAPDSKWVWVSGQMHHPESVGLAYRSITQAWDFPLVFYSLQDLDGCRVKADLLLDNGNNYRKKVVAEFEVDRGLIIHATLHDSEPVLYNG